MSQQNARPEAPQPALTPEEWRKLQLWNAGKLPGGRVRGMVVLDLPDDHRPGAAACALFGQPWGFTQADVAKLIEYAEWLQGHAEGTADERDGKHFRSLASRIASLLPPVGPPQTP